MVWARAGCSLDWLHLRQSTSAPTAMTGFSHTVTTGSTAKTLSKYLKISCQIIGIHTCYESAYCFGMATPYSSIQRAVASFAGGCRCLHMRLRTIFHEMFRSGFQWFDGLTQFYGATWDCTFWYCFGLCKGFPSHFFDRTGGSWRFRSVWFTVSAVSEGWRLK